MQNIMKALMSGASALAIFTATFASPVFAGPLNLPTRIEKRIEKVERGEEKLCASVNNRIDNRISAYNNNKEKHLIAYKNIKERAAHLADRLDKKGYNTTKLRADGQTLNDKITKAAADYTNFITKLAQAKTQDCGNAQGVFRTTVKEALAILVTFRADVADIRVFIRTVLHPDIRALKSQTPKPTPSSSL